MPNGMTYIGNYISVQRQFCWDRYFRKVTIHRSWEIYSDLETKGTLKQVLKQYHAARKEEGKVAGSIDWFNDDAYLAIHVLETYRDDIEQHKS